MLQVNSPVQEHELLLIHGSAQSIADLQSVRSFLLGSGQTKLHQFNKMLKGFFNAVSVVYSLN